MVMSKETPVRIQRGRNPCGACGKGVEANVIWCQCCKRWCHQRRSGLRNLRRTVDNFRFPTCVRGVVAVPQRLEVGEDSLEIVDNFRYLGDVILCGGGVKSAVRDRISCAWCKSRELTSLPVNHSIPLEERAKVYCACVRPVLLYAAEFWALTERLEGLVPSCDYRMPRYMSKVRT